MGPAAAQMPDSPTGRMAGALLELAGAEDDAAVESFPRSRTAARAVDLEYWSESLFVGEPTSSAPNFIGENQIFTLPYSEIRVSVSDRYDQRGGCNPTDQRIWIAPDLIAELTSGQFRNNFDPAMEAIRTFVSASDSDQDEESDFDAD